MDAIESKSSQTGSFFYNAFANTAICIVMLWLVGATISSPYYNYQYARKHGVMAWLFFGELIATLESRSWPFDLASALFSSEPHKRAPNAKQKAELEHLRYSMQYVKSANDLGLSLKSFRNRPQSIDGKLCSMLSLYEQALDEAEVISEESLAAIDKDLPVQFARFRKGILVIVAGLRGHLDMRIEPRRLQEVGHHSMQDGERMVNGFIAWCSRRSEK
jgi:hypothetical protein